MQMVTTGTCRSFDPRPKGKTSIKFLNPLKQLAVSKLGALKFSELLRFDLEVYGEIQKFLDFYSDINRLK
jgi:hypothetical protein